MVHRVVITGIGIVSPFGVGRKILFENLIAGNVSLKYDSMVKTVVGKIPEGTAKNELNLALWRDGERRQMSRGEHYFYYIYIFLEFRFDHFTSFDFT